MGTEWTQRVSFEHKGLMMKGVGEWLPEASGRVFLPGNTGMDNAFLYLVVMELNDKAHQRLIDKAMHNATGIWTYAEFLVHKLAGEVCKHPNLGLQIFKLQNLSKPNKVFFKNNHNVGAKANTDFLWRSPQSSFRKYTDIFVVIREKHLTRELSENGGKCNKRANHQILPLHPKKK